MPPMVFLHNVNSPLQEIMPLRLVIVPNIPTQPTPVLPTHLLPILEPPSLTFDRRIHPPHNILTIQTLDDVLLSLRHIKQQVPRQIVIEHVVPGQVLERLLSFFLLVPILERHTIKTPLNVLVAHSSLHPECTLGHHVQGLDNVAVVLDHDCKAPLVLHVSLRHQVDIILRALMNLLP